MDARTAVFAGIVESMGKIVRLERDAVVSSSGGRAHRLTIDMPGFLEGLSLGASIAVNGVCLTLASRQGDAAGFDVIPETWNRTALHTLHPGDFANLERALRVGDRIDGHFVQGHVDGVATVERVHRSAGEHKLWLRPQAELLPYMIRKGSIAIDGVSLTLVDVAGETCSVALIPTTVERTTLGRRRPGDLLNIETDVLARILVSRLEQTLASPSIVVSSAHSAAASP